MSTLRKEYRTSPLPPPGPKRMVEWYLLSYNQVSFLGWFWILFLTATELNDHHDYKNVFRIIWSALSYVQTAALFDVIHSFFGWLKVDFTTTLLHTAQRLFMVWGVNYFIPEIHDHWSFTMMVIAWSLSQCIKYTYSIFEIASGVPGIISWVKHNSIFLLYPMSVFAELTMMIVSLQHVQGFYYYGLVFMMTVYIFGCPMLFQRYKSST